MITRVKLNVKPLSGTTVDSLNNNRVDSPLPYTVTEIETYAKPSAWYIPCHRVSHTRTILFLIGFYSLIRLLIHLTPQSIYTSQCTTPTLVCIYQRKFKNSHSHRRMANRKAAMNQISIPGYKIISYVGYSPDWVAIILPILFAEIFAIGVKMKEEQDLTI